jgi:flagellar hook-basal body complex protein FliE
VRSVDEKSKVADSEVRRLMLGESDNIHRSMIAMQESGLAFGLLVEVRNKLVESYQELMRMPV